ncbi:MAG: hypothetical protein Q9201_001438 [Fulgogasparrea decipioides]
MISWYGSGIERWIPSHLPAITSLHLATTLPVLQDAAFFSSLGWILYRIWQIYQKPVDELVDLLGLDIPPVPDVSLAGITVDSVLLYWKPADNQSTSLKNAIQVNGIKVGEFGHKDTSIQVTGLKPGHYYNIRVIATNSANFSTLGPLIRLRTVPAINKDGDHFGNLGDDNVEEPADECEAAGIRAGPSQIDSAAHAPSSQMIKDVSTAQTSSRKVVSGRRASPAISGTEPPSLLSSRATSVDEDDSEEAIQRLTEQLDRLRHEQHDTDKQVDDEDQEHGASIADLTRDRDQLRQALKEKEDLTAELRKHGAQLEKMNRTAQSRKATKERILHQKQAELQKIKDDIDRWDTEIVLMCQQVDRMAREKERITAAKDADIAKIRDHINKDHGLIKELEDEIRTRGIQIKSMEKDREHLESHEDFEQHTTSEATSSDHVWEIKAQTIDSQLKTIWQTLQQVEAENQHAQDRVSYWTSRRSRDPAHFAPLSVQEYSLGSRPTRFRRQRQVGSGSNAVSMPFTGYQGGFAGVPYNPSNASPHFASAWPFFNMSNGMTLTESAAPAASDQLSQTLNDSDILAGGGPMSPAANDLLPSNLFRDEDVMLQESATAIRPGRLSAGNSEWPETHSITTADNLDAYRHTPGSGGSRRGSLLSSPYGSIQNVHGGQSSGDTFADNDQLSIHSAGGSALPGTNSNSSPLGASRLAQFFPAFNRQRGKTSAHEPPALGTLKQGQSQSFPRNIEQDSLDTTLETRRRRGSYGNWALPMAGLLSRSGAGADDTPRDPSIVGSRNAPGPRSRLNIFGTRVDTEGTAAFHERSSSRPSSMYSFDQLPARPSSDSQRLGGWPVTEITPSRSSPLGANWSTSGGPWSRAPSRRPSAQYGSTSNLSIGSTPLDSEAFDNALVPQRSGQLPIGTRPLSSQRSSTPKLNPAAPTFKTLFGRSDARKAAKAERANEKAAEKERAKEAEKANADEIASLAEESTTSLPRLSRDAGSITTAGSAADSHDSLDHSTSGTTSEATPSSATRESFMQKITRKSSSSKFNVPWGKERGGLFSRKVGEPSAPGEVGDDVPQEGHVTKNGESAASTPQQDKSSRTSLSWPNMRRKSRKGGPVVERGVDNPDDDDD